MTALNPSGQRRSQHNGNQPLGRVSLIVFIWMKKAKRTLLYKTSVSPICIYTQRLIHEAFSLLLYFFSHKPHLGFPSGAWESFTGPWWLFGIFLDLCTQQAYGMFSFSWQIFVYFKLLFCFIAVLIQFCCDTYACQRCLP